MQSVFACHGFVNENFLWYNVVDSLHCIVYTLRLWLGLPKWFSSGTQQVWKGMQLKRLASRLFSAAFAFEAWCRTWRFCESMQLQSGTLRWCYVHFWKCTTIRQQRCCVSSPSLQPVAALYREEVNAINLQCCCTVSWWGCSPILQEWELCFVRFICSAVCHNLFHFAFAFIFVFWTTGWFIYIRRSPSRILSSHFRGSSGWGWQQ
jgi:hypothetical protein